MATIPIVSMQPTGVTASKCIGNLLYVARASVFELYQVVDFNLLFVTSVTLQESIFYIYSYYNSVIVILQSVALVLDGKSLYTLQTLDIDTPGVAVFDTTSRPFAAFCESEGTLLIAAGASHNFLNLYDLNTGERQIHRFSSGQLIDLVAYQNSIAILAKSNLCDPSLILNSFASLRLAYLQIFNVKGIKLTELLKMTQLPSDAYALQAGFGGFIVLAPRYFIFKRLNYGDLRFRFSMLYEETEVDIEYIYQLFEKNFDYAINFDFRNLVKGKVINHLSNNIYLENDYIHCITYRRLPLAPRCLVPGHPVPDLYEFFKFYGYNTEEISMKMSQILNIIGDYPVCDFVLEAELRRYRDGNINFIGIMNYVYNFMEIPPLYNCCFGILDDYHAIVIDENGLSYTLYMNEEEVKMYPIVHADKDLPIRTDFRVHSVSCLFKRYSTENLFTLATENEKRAEFVVFTGSFTQDSYICRLQMCKDVPSETFYNDHRQKEHVTGNMYRTALLEEIRKNCAIINKDSEKKVKQVVNTEMTSVGPDFFHVEANAEVLTRLFPAEYSNVPCTAFYGPNIFGISQESRHQLLENEIHGVMQYTTIIPSLAAVVDSACYQVSVYSQATSLFLLNNTGVIQRCQTKLSYRKMAFIPNVGTKTRNIHFLHERSLAGEDEFLVLATEKMQNRIFRIFSIQNTYKIEDCGLFPDLLQKTVLATYYASNLCTYVATTYELFELDFIKYHCKVRQLSSSTLVNATFVRDGLVACSHNQLMIYLFSMYCYTYPVSAFAYMLGCSVYGLQLQAVYAYDCEQDATRVLFPQMEDCIMLATITLSNSAVLLLAVKPDLTLQLLFKWQPVDVSNGYYVIAARSRVDMPIIELTDEKQWNQLLFSSVMPFFSKCYAGTTLYMFAATRGGCVCVFHYNTFSKSFTLIDGLNDPISPPPDRSSYYEIDYWANNYAINQTECYIRDVRPFRIVIQNGVQCVLISYPTPTKTTIPAAKIAVPGLHGAISIFQLGSTVSSIRLTNTNIYPPNAFPPRCCFQLKNQQIVGLFDTKQPINAQDIKTTETSSLGIFSLDFGRFYSSLFELPFYRGMQCNFLQYSASLAQNSINLRRTMIALPFYADKLVFHNKTYTIVIVGSANRFEIRPPRSMTKDEVANIRIFETVYDEYDRNMKEEEIIANCHSLIYRNPPPINSFASIHHQHLFLIAKNVIVDSSYLELSRLEHANEVISDLVFSMFPLRFGRYWQGHNLYMDRFGRMDRRNKNDDSSKRYEAFALQHQQTRQEYREMVIICSNYTLGSFYKCYGKIQIHAVEYVTEKTEHQDSELYAQLQPLMEEQFESRALRRNININFFILKQSRFPFGYRYYQLNKIAFEELQNAVTACVAAPNAKCLMLAESKHIKCYELVDSYKLQLNAQWLGLGHITKLSRVQDFFLATDGICESRLFVFKNQGKRISEMTTLSRDIGGLQGEFLINQFNNQLYEVFSIGKNIGIFNYKYTERKERRERMQLVQIVPLGQTIAKLVKSLTILPLPAEYKFQSGVSVTIVTIEGGIIQLVPVPHEICQICGLEKNYLKISGKLSVFDQQSSIGTEVTNKYDEDVKSYVYQLIYSKVRLSAGTW